MPPYLLCPPQNVPAHPGPRRHSPPPLPCSNLPCFDFMFCTVAQISAEAPVFAELAHLDHLELL